MAHENDLDTLVATVLRSGKYRKVSPDLVRAIGAAELAKRPSLKIALKATRRKLHQVGGAYLDAPPNYAHGLALLRAAAGDPAALRDACRTLMQWHASTRERLPILDTFFTTTLAGLPPLRSVLDLACGLNPLAWPWMPLDPTATYVAYDIYADAVDFVGEFMRLAGVNGRAAVRDVLHDPPTEPVDLALLLKTLPCLEQLAPNAAQTLLDALNARYLLISYPVASLGGRRKGMSATYTAQFAALAHGRSWTYQRFEFATELAFLVKTAA
jgi:16S rRNA (guanine(1405)-N(7))-methyltransferase